MNKSIVYEIVSNSDTIISLRNPCIDFANWDPSPKREDAAGEPTVRLGGYTKKKKGKKGISKRPVLEDQEKFNAAKSGSKSAEQSIFSARPSQAKGDTTVAEAAELERCDKNSDPPHITLVEDPEVKKEPQAEAKLIEEQGIRFRVCAGSLMSASPWFNRVLKKNGWMESEWNQKEKSFQISAQDWDEEAFLILLNIFHFRNRQVPRTISLDLMAKIAVLVDYYECNESIELFLDIWMADLRVTTPVPTTYCRDLILWLWVSWILRIENIFKEATTTAIKKCTEPIRNLGLPIPDRITDAMDGSRYLAIKYIVDGLHGQREAYQSVAFVCPVGSTYSFRCGCMLLGAIIKGMDDAEILSPRPRSPFPDQDFETICAKIRSIRSETWHHGEYTGRYPEAHVCNISTDIDRIADKATEMVEELSLSVFLVPEQRQLQ